MIELLDAEGRRHAVGESIDGGTFEVASSGGRLGSLVVSGPFTLEVMDRTVGVRFEPAGYAFSVEMSGSGSGRGGNARDRRRRRRRGLFVARGGR